MKENKWVYLVVLSLMWGSSFILMKKALLRLSPIQIGALRILVAGAVLLSFGFKKVLKIKKKHWGPIAQVAFIASFFPAFFIWILSLIGLEALTGILMYYVDFPLGTQAIHLLAGALLFGLQFYLLIQHRALKKN